MLDDRLVFARDEPEPRSDRNLWELSVDLRTGEPRGEPRRLTDWVGLRIKGLSATDDGSKLVFRDDHNQRDVWVGELGGGGRRLDDLRRLTLDDRDDELQSWTPDGRGVVFASERYGSSDLLVRDLDAQAAIDLVVAPGTQEFAATSPDGTFFFYADIDDPGERASVKRIPIGGGPTTRIGEIPISARLHCAMVAGAPCVLAERDLQRARVTWSSWDPENGKGKELWHAENVPAENGLEHEQISPDGDRLASYSDGTIFIREIPTGRTTEIETTGVPGWATGLSWAADGNGFYLATAYVPGGALLHVDLEGHATLLYDTREFAGISGPIPSPDGRYLAFTQTTRDSNIWVVDDF
jgi:WD40 repeat protein